MTAQESVRCSDVEVEPLPGSAKQESRYLLIEHAQGWSRDILDGDTFGYELTEKLQNFLDASEAGLQLIRLPGREARHPGPYRVFLVWADLGVAETLTIDQVEEVLSLDMSAPGINGANSLTDPLVLVCTHGRRDVCCAVKGRSLAAILAHANKDVEIPLVWETSHTKGHRFAPSVLLMPWGYSFGRLIPEAGEALVESARRGEYFLPGNRGRGMYGPRGQVAELAVADLLVRAGEVVKFGELSATDVTVSHIDGRQWSVSLERQIVDGIIPSCGKSPQTGDVWVASDVVLHPGTPV